MRPVLREREAESRHPGNPELEDSRSQSNHFSGNCPCRAEMFRHHTGLLNVQQDRRLPGHEPGRHGRVAMQATNKNPLPEGRGRGGVASIYPLRGLPVAITLALEEHCPVAPGETFAFAPGAFLAAQILDAVLDVHGFRMGREKRVAAARVVDHV